MTIYFTPYSWSKLIFLRDAVSTEIGMFGINGDSARPELVTDMIVPKQSCTTATVDCDVDHLQDLQLDCFESGLAPWQISRVWIHTHPDGCGPQPSHTDLEQFAEFASETDYYVFVILSKTGESYGEIRYSRPAHIARNVPIAIDWSYPFSGSDHADWQSLAKRVSKPAPVFKSAKRVKTKSKSKTIESFPIASAVEDDDLDFQWDDMNIPLDPEQLAEKTGVSLDSIYHLGLQTENDIWDNVDLVEFDF